MRTKMNDGDNVNDDDDHVDIISLLACCKIKSVWAFTFTFQNYLKLWKQLLLSSVTPQLCCLMTWEPTMAIEIQTEDRPYSCPQCDLPQLQPVRLLNHQCFQTEKTHALVHRSQSCLAVRFPEVRNRKGTEGGPVHIGEKPVVSKQRNFFCTPAGSLKIHMLIHSGGKSFACTRCSYSCTQADDLKKHLLAHSGEKPFVHITFWLLTV